MKFETREAEKYTIVSLETGGVIEPSILKELKPPKVNAKKGIILTGRGPIWLYGFLVHFYHPTAWVATYDPRLGGAVVVESHVPGVEPGDVIPIKEVG
ncbi:CRISPR-associated ring nuclease Crn3/Csx3 [Thermococcus sp. Bubb.Bath]|uniref:CRISPR-associated ring nuclease Crn3/Csx3 n=1 Tax=Thermococcus sp. Bubb.Bath TaxID=1638242 RepID=UPI003183B6B4